MVLPLNLAQVSRQARSEAVLTYIAVSCPAFLTTMNAATNGPAKATAYCMSYLGLTPVTKYSTSTKVVPGYAASIAFCALLMNSAVFLRPASL
jgi:hypothetical protein